MKLPFSVKPIRSSDKLKLRKPLRNIHEGECAAAPRDLHGKLVAVQPDIE